MNDELHKIIDELDAAVRNDGLLLLAANERERTLSTLYSSGEPHEETRLHGSFPYSGLTGRALERRTPMLVNDAHLDPRALIYSDPVVPEAMILYPLLRDGVVVGAVNVYRSGAGEQFAEQDLDRLAPFAQRLADAL